VNIPNESAPASFPNDSSGPTASTSVIQSTAVPDLLATDLLSTPSGAPSPPQPIFGLSAITSAIESAAGNRLAAELGALSFLPTSSDAAEHLMPSKRRSNQRRREKRNYSDSFIQHYTDFTFLGSLAYASNTTTVIATPLSGSSGSTSATATATAIDETLAAKLEAVVSLSTPSGAASPSQPIFDLSTITSAINAVATGNPEQFTPSKKHSKRRKRANRNTSDSFIQRSTDLAFRFCALSSCIEW